PFVRRTPRSPPFPYTTLFRSRRLASRPIRADFNANKIVLIKKWLARIQRFKRPHGGLHRAMLLPRLPHFRARQPNRPYIYESLRSEEHTSELQSRENLVCRLL